MPSGVYPHTHIKPKVYVPEMVERVRILYIDHGLSQVEIAEHLGLSQKSDLDRDEKSQHSY